MDSVQVANSRVLCVLDADRIHEYVFSPRQLRLVRGASSLQAELNLTVLPELVTSNRGQLIYAGGGTLLADFKDSEGARAFEQAAKSEFRKRTAIATASFASLPLSDGGFAPTWDKLRARLEQVKSGRQERRASISNPYWKRCEACGVHAAESFVTTPGGAPEAYCRACRLRLEQSSESRYFRIVKSRFGLQARPPRDFEEMGSLATPEGYLGFVYLDGDRLGRWLSERVQDEDDFRRLSREIREGMEAAVFGAAAALCDGDTRIAPFEILLLGGDDALVALAADRVAFFLRRFHESFQEINLSYSAGVVLTHSHYPIADGIAEAEKLLRAAKSEGGGRVDYRLITGSAPDANPDESGRRRNTMRPYTHSDWFALTDRILEWKKAGLPRNKVNDLYPLAYEEPEQAEFEYLYLRSRLSRQQRELLNRSMPTLRDENGRTPAADLVELWEFVS